MKGLNEIDPDEHEHGKPLEVDSDGFVHINVHYNGMINFNFAGEEIEY